MIEGKLIICQNCFNLKVFKIIKQVSQFSLFRSLEHSVQFTDIESGLGKNSSRRKKLLKTTAVANRVSTYFKDKGDGEKIQKTQLSKFKKEKSCFKNCWKKFNDTTIKLRSIIANIFINSIDTGTDAVAARIHYK